MRYDNTIHHINQIDSHTISLHLIYTVAPASPKGEQGKVIIVGTVSAKGVDVENCDKRSNFCVDRYSGKRETGSTVSFMLS